MNVLYVTADKPEEWNCSEWRCVLPSLAINMTEGNAAHLITIENFNRNDELSQKECAWADVIVLQRNAFNNVIVGMEYWKAQGKTVILDLDDGYFDMPANCRAYDFWYNGHFKVGDGRLATMTYKPVEQILWAAKLAHAVTTPSEVIAQDWRDRGARAYTVPNYAFLPRYQVTPAPRTDDFIVIGWGGSLSHVDSFRNSGVVTALNRVARKYPNVRVAIGGGDTAIRRMFDLPPDHITLHPWVRPEEWPLILASFDIGIAPLAGRYDRRRSWIKGMEYTIMGVPWIGTDYEPFAQVEGGKRVGTGPKFWEEALAEYIEHIQDKKALAKARQADLTRYDICANIEKVIQTYQTIRYQATGELS